MALSFGWRANDIRESIWRDDSALQSVPLAALEAWREDGDASHLRPYATNGTPSVLTYRALSPDEARFVQGLFSPDANELELLLRSWLLCFRIGVDVPDAPAVIPTPDGASHLRVVRDRGIRMLANEFVSDLETRYPGIVAFYGNLIHRATFPTPAEKKASSPPSTPTPSSGPGDSQTAAGNTAPPNEETETAAASGASAA